MALRLPLPGRIEAHARDQVCIRIHAARAGRGCRKTTASNMPSGKGYLMGGQSKTTQQQTSSTDPWAAAAPALQGILGGLTAAVGPASVLSPAQTGALNSIEANAAQGNKFANPISDATMGLLNGGGAQNNDAAIRANLAGYTNALQPVASGANIGGNSALQPYLDAAKTDATNSINPMFAAAGRDLSPANMQALGRGWSTGEAPIIANQYNTDVQRQMDAIQNIYNAGNTTWGLLNQNQNQANANMQAGAGLAPSALDAGNWQGNTILQMEAMRTGIPMQNLTTLLGAVSPVAQAFGTQSSSGSSTSTMSPLQQATAWAGILNPSGSNAFNPTKWMFS
jgi:hypothetical protein